MQHNTYTSTKASIVSRTIAFSYITLASIVFFLASCSQDNSDYIINHNQPTESEVLSHLEAHGYDISLINIEGDFVVYEDIVIAMESVIQDMTNPTPEVADEDLPLGVDTRQRGVSITHALTNANARNGLNVYISPSILKDCGPNVLQSIHDAVAEIRAIENTTLNMKVVDNRNDANITIGSDLDNTIFPEASPFYDVAPYSMLANVSFMGIAGPYIAVDPKWENINYNTIKSAMMHELGHTIGLHHTGTASGEEIHHTPEDQATSIMNPVAISTGKFSVWDKKAIRMYYAKELSRPTNLKVTKDGSAVTINYNNPKKTWQPYFWVRVYRYDADNKLDTYQDFPADVISGKGIVTWENQPNGQYSYRIKGMRFKKDIKSKVSAKVLVDQTHIASAIAD